ncbi:MAG: carboxypeptidase regulatory-like domain-containing protein [Planctomycetes bacterium]|nr:carboxypeptidase regulatory-like domain-containing protein [Planctomycetota bacterium]
MRVRTFLWALLVVGVASAAWTVVRRTGSAPGPGAPARREVVGTGGRSAVLGVVRRGGRPTSAWVEVRFALFPGADAIHRSGRGGFFARALGAPLALEAAGAVARAGPDGAFVASGLAPGVYDVRAVADDGAEGHAVATIALDGARAAVEVTLPAPAERATLAGRVLAADGSPWRGLVAAEPVGGPDADRAVTASLFATAHLETDAQGRFRIEGLLPGVYRATVLEVGALRAASRPLEVASTTEVVLRLGPTGVVTDGRTISDDDARAVAGVEVVAAGRGGSFEMTVRRTVSDALGRWRLELPPGNERTLFAAANGWAWWIGTVSEAGTGGATDVRLLRHGRLDGRVVAAESGAPVAGVRVTARPTRGAVRAALPTATTDPDGRFALDGVPSGDVVAAVEGGGWVTERLVETLTSALGPATATVPPGGVATVEVRVRRAARLSGTVRDGDGRAVEGAIARVDLAPPDAPPTPVASCATDASGAFAFDGLADGASYVLVVTAPDRRTTRADVPAVSSSEPATVDVALPPARRASVEVVEDGGAAPVPFARVSWVETPPRAPPVVRTFTAGAGGVATVGPLPAGEVRLRAEHEDAVESGTASLAPEATRVRVALRRGLALHGTVVEDGGRPVPLVRVSLVPADPAGTRRPAEATDGEGRFVFRGLAPGRYVLTVLRRVPGEPERSAEVAADAGGEATLTLARSAALADALVVHVRGPDGAPVPRARVRVREEGRVAWEGEAKDGVATVAGAPLAPRLVDVFDPTDAAGAPLAAGPATVGPVVRGTDRVEVSLPPPRAIAGVVVGPDRAPVPGAAVFAVRPGDDPVLGLDRAARAVSDADGRFRLDGQGDVDVTLVVHPPDAFLAPTPVAARGGRTGLVLTLRASPVVVVTVLGPDDRPVADAVVEAASLATPDGGSPEATRRVARTGADGRASLRGVEPGRPGALVVTPPPEPPRFAAEVRPWTPRDTRVRLVAARRAVGVVRDPSGVPLQASVAFRARDGRSGGAVTGADGRFELLLPDEDGVVLDAWLSGAAPPRAAARVGSARRTLAAGETDASVVIDPGADLVVRVTDPDGGAVPTFLLARVRRADGSTELRAATLERETATLRGLARDDLVSLFVAPDARGRSALARDAAPGREARLRLDGGLSVTGTAEAPAWATEVRVSAWCEEFDATVEGTRDADGRFEVRGLPEGTTWRVLVQATGGGRTSVARGAPVAAGARDVRVAAD